MDCYGSKTIISIAFAAVLSQPTVAAERSTTTIALFLEQNQYTVRSPFLAQDRAALNLESRYANNVIVRITNISFTRDNIILALEVINDSEIAIQLNGGMPGEGIVLLDDLGNQYSFVPPRNNPAVGLQPGAELRGEFVFTGSVSPSANSLTLITNSGAPSPTATEQGENSPPVTEAPRITISDIPVGF